MSPAAAAAAKELATAVYSVSQKKIPPRGPDIFSFFSQTVENL